MAERERVSDTTRARGDPTDDAMREREQQQSTGQRKRPSEAARGIADQPDAGEAGHGDASSRMLAALKDVSFPATKREVLDAVGNRVVALPDGRTVPMSTVVEKTARAEYGSARDLVAEADAMWRDIDRAAHGE